VTNSPILLWQKQKEQGPYIYHTGLLERRRQVFTSIGISKQGGKAGRTLRLQGGPVKHEDGKGTTMASEYPHSLPRPVGPTR